MIVKTKPNRIPFSAVDGLRERQPARRAIAAIVLLVAWAAVIYGMSAQPADRSNAQSEGVSQLLARLFCADFDALPPGEQSHILERYHYLVRKGSHLCEYMILGALLLSAWQRFRARDARRMALAWCCAWAVAASDEFLQTFVDGRSGQILDVCIDAYGALMGMMLLQGIVWMRRRRRARAI